MLNRKMDIEELVYILCDTGALSANYVSADLIKRIRSRLDDKDIMKTKCRVILADSRTVKPLKEAVKLNLKVEDKRARTHTYTGEFFVLDMKSQDIILGLPALTGKLYPFMDQMLREANQELKDSGGYEVELNQIDEMQNTKDLEQRRLNSVTY